MPLFLLVTYNEFGFNIYFFNQINLIARSLFLFLNLYILNLNINVNTKNLFFLLFLSFSYISFSVIFTRN